MIEFNAKRAALVLASLMDIVLRPFAALAQISNTLKNRVKPKADWPVEALYTASLTRIAV